MRPEQARRRPLDRPAHVATGRGAAARRAVALAAVAVVALGCSAAPDELIDGAPAALHEHETARFELSITTTADGVDSGYTATGEQDLETGAIEMEADLGGTSTRQVTVDDVTYMSGSLFETFTGDQDGWVSVDLAEAGADAGLDVEALSGGPTGPAALIAQLRGAAGEVREVGSEEIRGVDTRHLQVTVETDRALEQAPEETREQLRTFAESSGLPDEYPMDVWIDGDGLPRRVRTVVEVEDEQLGPITQQTTLELYDFGAPVDIEAPPEERVTPIDELIADLEALDAALQEEQGGAQGPG